MATILNLRVTIRKNNLKDSYFSAWAPFSVLEGQKLQFDDDRNELIVKLPDGKLRKVKMAKAYMETFTEYV